MIFGHLRIPFLIAVLAHGGILYSLTGYLSRGFSGPMEITAMEVMELKEPAAEEPAAPEPVEPVTKKAEPARKEEPKEEPVKEEPKPQPVEEDQHAEVASEEKTDPAPVNGPHEPEAPAEVANVITEAPAAPAPKEAVYAYSAPGPEADEMTLFHGMVRSRIEKAKFYPRWARERGFEGTVGVRFEIMPDGSVREVKVVRPCHCDVLNKAACDAIKKAAPFAPVPGEAGAGPVAMEIDIGFRLDKGR